MNGVTLFLSYQEDPLFFRSLMSIEKWLSTSFPKNTTFEVFIFYKQSLPIETLKQQYPHTRWWRIPVMYPENYWLLNKAMAMSKHQFFFYLDGKAIYAKTDFINMTNLLKQEGFLCILPKKYLPSNKNKFWDQTQILRNQIYSSLNNSLGFENFRLIGFDKEFMKDFFLSLSAKKRFAFMRQKLFDKEKKIKVPYFFLNLFEERFGKLPYVFEGITSRFSILPLPLFSFYPKLFSLLAWIHQKKGVPNFINKAWFHVPIVHLSFFFLLIFYFSPLMIAVSLLFIVLFSFIWLPPNSSFKLKTTQERSLLRVFLFPFQKIIAVFLL